MGIFKSRTDLQYLRQAATAAGVVCDALMAEAQGGVSTVTLEQMANKLLQQHRSLAPFKSFEGFGHASCISINDEIVNAPPSRERILKEGDLVSIAVGTNIRGFHGKAARTAVIGKSFEDADRLIQGTRQALDAIVAKSAETNSLKSLLGEIGLKAQQYRLRLIKGTGGFAIGKSLHEIPYLPNHAEDLEQDITLPIGMALVFMPMMTLGETSDWVEHEDGWTQVTADGALSAHFADTFLMTEAGLVNLSRSIQ